MNIFNEKVIKKLKRDTCPQIVTATYICVMLTIFILCMGDGGYGTMYAVKKQVYAVIHAVYLPAVILATILCWRGKTYDFHLQKIRGCETVLFLSILYGVFVWISDLKSCHWPKIMIYMDTYSECTLVVTVYLITFLFVVVTLQEHKFYFTLFSIILTVQSVLCVIQTLDVDIFGWYGEGRFFTLGDGLYYQGQYAGTLGNTNITSAFVSAGAVMIITYIMRSADKRRFLLLPSAAMALLAQLKLDADQGTIGILCAIAMLVFALLPSKRWRVAVVCMTIVAIGAAAVVVYNLDTIVDYTGATPPGLLGQVRDMLHGDFNDRQGTGRIGLWKDVISRIPERFFWGHGSQTMIWGDLKISSRHSIEQGQHLTSAPAAAHNVYLNIWYSNGIFALLSYVFLQIFVMMKWVRNAAKDKVIAVTGAGLMCYAVQSMFGLSTLLTTPFYWLLLAFFCTALVRLKTSNCQLT